MIKIGHFFLIYKRLMSICVYYFNYLVLFYIDRLTLYIRIDLDLRIKVYV